MTWAISMFIANCNNLSTIQAPCAIVHGNHWSERLHRGGKIEIKRHLPAGGGKWVANRWPRKLSGINFEFIIENYTAESGVRNLKPDTKNCQHMAVLHTAKDEEPAQPKISNKCSTSHVKVTNIRQRYCRVVTDWPWTQVGGDILFTGSSLSKGIWQINANRQLWRDVMKEKRHHCVEHLEGASAFNYQNRVFEENNVILFNVPEAVPRQKDDQARYCNAYPH